MAKKMIAKFSGKFEGSQGPTNARNYSDSKETVGGYKLICHRDGEWLTVADVRFYMGRSKNASQVYCAAWFHGPQLYCSGAGVAGGYGYHKQSAALDGAIRSAGIELSYIVEGDGTEPHVGTSERAYIHGAGESAMEQALYAIGVVMGCNRADLFLVNY